MLSLRKLGSRLQGHPNMEDLPDVDMSTGSLGQGLSAAVGMAWGTGIWERTGGPGVSVVMANWRKDRSGKQPWRRANSVWTT